MIELSIVQKRATDFWDGVNPVRVNEYRQELTKVKEELDKLPWGLRRLITQDEDDKRLDELKGLIRDELDLCDFYTNYLERQQEPNFDTWYQEELKEHWSSWVRYNGKIRATIMVGRKTGSQMTKVSLRIENDSDQLKFLTNNYGGSRKEITYSHLRNPKSIAKRVDEYRERAEKLMKEHQYPLYSQELRNFRVLEGLLHIEEADHEEQD